MRRLGPGIVVSVLLHAGLLALALLVWPQPEREITAGTIPVTIVSDVVAEAAAGQQPEPGLEPVEEPAAEEVPAEETPTPPEPTPPTPTPAPQRPTPTPPRPAPAEKAPTPRPQPERPRPQPPAREESSIDLESIIRNPAPGSTRPTRPAPGESGPGRAPAATGPQINAIAGQIYEHWNLNCSVAGMDELVIPIRLTLTSNGRITDGPVVHRQQSGPVFRAAADSALRAVRAAEPFDLPGDFTTQELILNFNTERACRNG